MITKQKSFKKMITVWTEKSSGQYGKTWMIYKMDGVAPLEEPAHSNLSIDTT